MPLVHIIYIICRWRQLPPIKLGESMGDTMGFGFSIHVSEAGCGRHDLDGCLQEQMRCWNITAAQVNKLEEPGCLSLLRAEPHGCGDFFQVWCSLYFLDVIFDVAWNFLLESSFHNCKSINIWPTNQSYQVIRFCGSVFFSEDVEDDQSRCYHRRFRW